MAAPPFGFQQQLNPDLLNQVAHSGDNTGWGPIVKQLLGAVQQGVAQSQQKAKQQQFQQMLSQLMGPQQQQQGPQMPTGPAIKGPQGYVPPGAGPMAVPAGQSPMPTNPSSGMGAAPPPFNGVDLGKLIGLYMQMDPQGMMGKLEGQMFQTPDQKAQADYLRWKMTQGNQQKPEFSPMSMAAQSSRTTGCTHARRDSPKLRPPGTGNRWVRGASIVRGRSGRDEGGPYGQRGRAFRGHGHNAHGAPASLPIQRATASESFRPRDGRWRWPRPAARLWQASADLAGVTATRWPSIETWRRGRRRRLGKAALPSRL